MGQLDFTTEELNKRLDYYTKDTFFTKDGDSIQTKLDALTFGQVLLIGPNPDTAYAGFNFSSAINNITVQGLTNWNGSSYPAVITGNVAISGTGIRFRLQNLQIDGTFSISNGGSNWVTEMYFGSTCDYSGISGFTQNYRVTYGGAVTGSPLALFIECSTPLTANLPTVALSGSYIFVNETNTWHFWSGSAWTDSGANNWPDAVEQLKFTEYEVGAGDSPYTMPTWNGVYNIDNSTSDIEIITPSATTGDTGSEGKFWIKSNPANHKVVIKAPNITHTINGVAGTGSDVAKAEFNSNKGSYSRVTAQVMGENEVNISGASTVFNVQRYVCNFSATSDYSPYSYLQLGSVPADFLTRNDSWWFAVKIEDAMTPDSDGQVLFGSNNFFVAYQGNGSYFMTSSTSGYLQTISPTTIIDDTKYIIYQYDSATTYYTAWVNGVKVLDATSSGVTPPSSAPSEMWFGSETGQSSPPSGYGYPLQSCKVSAIMLGSGNLTDAQAAEFTSNVYTPSDLATVTPSNAWIFDNAGASTQAGAIPLTLVGTNIGTELL